MIMLPENAEAVQGGEAERRASSRTYRVDLDKKRITGIIDGKEALKQAVLFALLTQRYEYAIYPHSYGTEWKKVIGEGSLKAMAAAKTVITDSLMCDDRINGVTDFEFERKAHSLKVRFRVDSVFGETVEEGEIGEDGGIVLY